MLSCRWQTPVRLDHEIHPSFNITLHVQGTGASDETVNDSIPLTIIVTNVDETDVFPYSDPALDTGITLTLSGSGSRRTGHVTVGDLPTGGTVIRVPLSVEGWSTHDVERRRDNHQRYVSLHSEIVGLHPIPGEYYLSQQHGNH